MKNSERVLNERLRRKGGKKIVRRRQNSGCDAKQGTRFHKAAALVFPKVYFSDYTFQQHKRVC